MKKNINFNNIQRLYFKEGNSDKSEVWHAHKLSEQASLAGMSVLVMRISGDEDGRYFNELQSYHARMIKEIVKIANYYDIRLQGLITLNYFLNKNIQNKTSFMSLPDFHLSIASFQTVVSKSFPNIDSKLHYTKDNGINNLEDLALKQQLYVDFGYLNKLKVETDSLMMLTLGHIKEGNLPPLDISNKLYECLLWIMRSANHFGVDLEHSISINYEITKEPSFEKTIK